MLFFISSNDGRKSKIEENKSLILSIAPMIISLIEKEPSPSSPGDSIPLINSHAPVNFSFSQLNAFSPSEKTESTKDLKSSENENESSASAAFSNPSFSTIQDNPFLSISSKPPISPSNRPVIAPLIASTMPPSS